MVEDVIETHRTCPYPSHQAQQKLCSILQRSRCPLNLHHPSARMRLFRNSVVRSVKKSGRGIVLKSMSKKVLGSFVANPFCMHRVIFCRYPERHWCIENVGFLLLSCIHILAFGAYESSTFFGTSSPRSDGPCHRWAGRGLYCSRRIRQQSVRASRQW